MIIYLSFNFPVSDFLSHFRSLSSLSLSLSLSFPLSKFSKFIIQSIIKVESNLHRAKDDDLLKFSSQVRKIYTIQFKEGHRARLCIQGGGRFPQNLIIANFLLFFFHGSPLFSHGSPLFSHGSPLFFPWFSSFFPWS